jgi:phage gp29-like protein
MSPLADFQIASNIIRGFKSAESLKNLSRYHKHQTRLLSEIFSNMEEKHLSTLVQSEAFLSDIKAINASVFP